MRVSHAAAGRDAVFDDPNLVSCGGLAAAAAHQWGANELDRSKTALAGQRCGSATVIGVRHGRGLDALTRHKPRRRVVTVVTPAAALPGATAHRAHHQRAGKVAAGGWGRVPRGVSWAPR